MTSILRKIFVVCAVTAAAITWGISSASGAGFDESAKMPESVGQVAPQAAATPTPFFGPQIDGNGTITAPNGGRDAQFFIFDVENQQVTPQFLEGQFGYLDKRSHINFTTGQIQTVTINGNQGAFTGTARIGGPRNRQTVQFTVTVTMNTGSTPDTFSIDLSNGYAASGNLTSGSIVIRTLDPDPVDP